MEQNHFVQCIEETYHSLTKAEKKVADFVLRNPRPVLFMSITDLADACQVGETSVYRFCRSMNMQGYQEFKMQLSLGMTETPEKENPPESNQMLGDTLKETAEKIMQSHLSALRETYCLLRQEDLEVFLERIEKAKRVFFFGIGDSLLIAQEACHKFASITGKAYCITDPHMQAIAASSMTQEDFAVMISYSGATKDNICTAKTAKQEGASVGCITRFKKSPLTAYSDVTLLCGAAEGPMDGGSVSAKVSQLYLIDLLYQEYYTRHYEECRNIREKASRAVVEKIF
ncbi:MAG TPA: MurR/RpiR family transcriptional regulator [Candidatus Fusicatenibacter intestinigallinarum]|uniref:MurR/RpiR family transcriptional regulator n=1 Tax=Candidatus Fusicatenibacter intestinigallinarum TaxID=2838598 RepID=A0A9D2NCL3_9FIRM|nr:MurR/RpiR family transcriptional regulator [Candidatus Fusicatenibacter intestinigallinarum]